ncbi:unnamed protein product [Spodoptera littoralis]|uniref:Uncharacterized protein n=1 Tax=Spodoptera littoralis TaxID=7109 RepID=A0A9P0HY96_SPOLI|nr:unnamed protein product [Spodoptera littoralis]CAH1636107.1 unnamed protein product [Spodoptera littoralis]
MRYLCHSNFMHAKSQPDQFKTGKVSYKLSPPILPTLGWECSKTFLKGRLRHNIHLHAEYQPDRCKTDKASYKR